MKRSIHVTLVAARLLAGVSLFAASGAWAQDEPKPNPLAETPDSGTMKRADKEDMALVLKKMQDIGIKPIESRSVEEARSQPTPADAVKAILKDKGIDVSAPSPELQAALIERAKPLWEEFKARVPDAAPYIDAYLKAQN